MAGKKGKRRNDSEKQRDYDVIRELKLKRYSLRRMAEQPELSHLSHAQIGLDLKAIEKIWRENTTIDIDGYKQQQLETHELLINELLQSWEKSKKDKIKKSVKDKNGDSKASQEKSIQTENNHGDSNYLREAKENLKEISKILGLYAPIKSENKNDNKGIVNISFKDG